MTPEQLKEGNRLQEEIEQLEELRKYDPKMCKFGWFVRTTKEIKFFKKLFVRKIMVCLIFGTLTISFFLKVLHKDF